MILEKKQKKAGESGEPETESKFKQIFNNIKNAVIANIPKYSDLQK